MQPSTLAKRLWLLLFIAIGLFYLYGLGHFALVGPDEPRYAEVAREMFQRHDLVTPTLGGHHWFEKPALLYWMMIASFWAFGVSEWTARLGPAVCGLVTIAAVYWIGWMIENGSSRKIDAGSQGQPGWTGANLGSISALVAASSGGLIVFSRAASFDIVITMALTCALAFFLAAEILGAEGRPINDAALAGGSRSSTLRSGALPNSHNRHWLLAGFYCFVGVSLLAKGLVGIVIPCGSLFVYFSLRGRLPDRVVIISLLWGLPLALAVALSWYGPVVAHNGWPFVDQFFIQHHFARYISNKYHHPQPIYFYLLIILLLTLPWTPFLIEALIKCRQWRWRNDDALNKSQVFLLAWFVLPIVFFSLSRSKLPGYILPSLPAAVLLAGERLAGFASRRSNNNAAMRSTALLLLLFSPLALLYAVLFSTVSLRSSLLIASPLIIAGAVALIWGQRRIPAAVMIGLSIMAAVGVSINCAAPRITNRETVRELLTAADALGYGHAPVIMFQETERTAEFYAAGRVAYAPDGEPVRFELVSQIVSQVHQNPGPILVITPPFAVSELTRSKELKTSVIGTNGNTTLAAVQLP